MSDLLYRYRKTFGPGILFACTAIGVSHLVQSTRAGAEFGFMILGFMICQVEIPDIMKRTPPESLVSGARPPLPCLMQEYFIRRMWSLPLACAQIRF